MNKTHSAPEVAIKTQVTGDKLYGGSSNRYYAEPERRTITIRVEANDQGEHVGFVTTLSSHIGTSPVLPDRASADAWVAQVSEYAATTLTGQIGNDQHPEGMFSSPMTSLCNKCGGMNTLRLSQEAWLDRITCTQCGDEYTYSIGD